MRSRAKHVIEGQKCTAYFLGLEKKKQGKTFIKELYNDKGEIVTETTDILQTVQMYYKNIFKSN